MRPSLETQDLGSESVMDFCRDRFFDVYKTRVKQ